MVKQEDIIMINIKPDLFRLAVYHTNKACFDGVSRIREGTDRKANMFSDNLTGQLANLALSLYTTGSFEEYHKVRQKANANPYIGDEGYDLLNIRIDIKGSKRQNPDRDLLAYNLPVRPHERHKDCVYILAILDISQKIEQATSHMIGLATEEMLPKYTTSGGIFKGAYILEAKNLIKLPKDGHKIINLLKNHEH